MSEPSRPKLSLTKKAPASGDGPKRGPVRSSGIKRHTGQGPSKLKGTMTDRPPMSRQPKPEAWDGPPKDPNQERLNKHLAALGHCSRREADEWIANGWVRVNGRIAETGQSVALDDHVQIDPRAHQRQDQRVTFVVHKPVGYVSGQAEDGHENASVLLVARKQWREDGSRLRFSPAMLRGLAPAGRLDIDSTGLLILTQDGRVARHIIGENSDVDTEYLVRVQWMESGEPVTENVQAAFPAERLELLRFGLSLDGEPLRRAEVDWLNPEQLRFVLREGKKRQIRRMCEAVGLKVVGLKRVRIGRLPLGNMPVGHWRFLGPHEQI